MKNKTIPAYSIILLAIIGLFSCSKVNEIDMLTQRVDELITLVEQHKEKNIHEYLTQKFSVAQRYNKKQFLQFLNYHLVRNKKNSVTLRDKNIIYEKDYADVTANALLIGASDWLPERGQIYIVASRWEKENGDWKMSKLRWEKK